MKKLIICFLFLLVAVWLGLQIQGSSGYVFISYKDYSIETTLWLAILGLFILFVVFYYLLRSFNFTFTIHKRIRKRWLLKRQRKSYSQTMLGLKELIEGRWLRAEKLELRAAKREPVAVINYLAAAYAAQKQKAFARSDTYLNKALKIDKNSAFAVNLMKAQMQIANNKWHEALTTLKELQALRSKHKLLLELLAKVYRQLQYWEELLSILPYLRKNKIYAGATLRDISVQIYCGLLRKFLQLHQHEKLEELWRHLPGEMRYQPEIVDIYVDNLVAHDFLKRAEDLVKKALLYSWNDALIEKYGKIKSVNPIKQLKTAERWLQEHPHNLYLLLCLGRICRQQKLWGKAQYYLQESLKIKPNTDANIELASIYETQNKLSEALPYYRNAIDLFGKE